MKIKCDYCGNTYEDTLHECPDCGAPNPSHKNDSGPKTIEDLKKLSNLGNNNVYRLKKEIQEELEENGYILPKGLIPMCEVVKKLKIDIDYLNRLANL